jgi:hypothetical protein
MYYGTGAGGSAYAPTWYRWAYGWEYGRGYETLTEEETQQAAKQLAAYRVQHPPSSCSDR